MTHGVLLFSLVAFTSSYEGLYHKGLVIGEMLNEKKRGFGS